MNTLQLVCLLGLVAASVATGTGSHAGKTTYRNMLGKAVRAADIKTAHVEPATETKKNSETKKSIVSLTRPDTTKYIANLHDYIDGLHTVIDKLSSIQTAGSIAFTAVRTADLGPVSQDTVVTYDKIHVNIGGNFQSSSAFHVPLDGLYYFSYKYHGSNVIVNIMMKADDVTTGTIVQTSAVGNGSMDISGTGFITLDLVAGNQIYLSLPADGGTSLIKADPTGQQIIFTGFLLYQRV